MGSDLASSWSPYKRPLRKPAQVCCATGLRRCALSRLSLSLFLFCGDMGDAAPGAWPSDAAPKATDAALMGACTIFFPMSIPSPVKRFKRAAAVVPCHQHAVHFVVVAVRPLVAAIIFRRGLVIVRSGAARPCKAYLFVFYWMREKGTTQGHAADKVLPIVGSVPLPLSIIVDFGTKFVSPVRPH